MKDLEDRLQELQCKIEEQGIGISESIEKDILKIMGEQTLDATPHMKFFWQEQMKLLQSDKMGRRYHPQVIRFALSLHVNLHQLIEKYETVVLLFSPVKEYLGTIRTISNLRLVLTKRMFKACKQRSHPSLLFSDM